jgi:DNA-binding transcriptional regulator YiaG
MYPNFRPGSSSLVNKYYPQTQDTFPQKLRAVRIAMGLYQQDFAARLEVTAQTVRNWEHGRAFPCRQHLKTLETLFAYKSKKNLYC